MMLKKYILLISAVVSLLSLNCTDGSNPLTDGDSGNSSIHLNVISQKPINCSSNIGNVIAEIFEGDGVVPITTTTLDCNDVIDNGEVIGAEVEGQVLVPEGAARRVAIEVFDPNGGLFLVGVTGATVDVFQGQTTPIEIALIAGNVLAVINGSGAPGSSNNSVPIFLANVYVATYLLFEIDYDSDFLTAIEVRPTSRSRSGQIFPKKDPETGIILGFGFTGEIAPGTGPIAEVVFDVDSGATSGNTNLTLIELEPSSITMTLNGTFRVR